MQEVPRKHSTSDPLSLCIQVNHQLIIFNHWLVTWTQCPNVYPALPQVKNAASIEMNLCRSHSVSQKCRSTPSSSSKCVPTAMTTNTSQKTGKKWRQKTGLFRESMVACRRSETVTLNFLCCLFPRLWSTVKSWPVAACWSCRTRCHKLWCPDQPARGFPGHILEKLASIIHITSFFSVCNDHQPTTL